MKQRSFKYFLSVILGILSLMCFMFGFIACKGNEGETDKTKEAITAWATQTNETVDYFDYYFAPMDIVVANGAEFLPAVKVENSKGEAVALVSDKFLVEDMDGYIVKFIVAYNGETFEKKITLNVVIANPNVFVGDLGNCYAGIDCLVPNIAVMENDGEKIDYSLKIFDSQNQELTITDGKFNAASAGQYFLTISTQGKNGNEIVHKEPFTVMDTPMGENLLLKDTLVNADWYTTEDGEMPEGFLVYGYKGIKSSGKNMQVAVDLGMSLELLREKFVSVEFDLMYEGDGTNAVNLKLSEDGAAIPVYNVQMETYYSSFIHWQRYIVKVPTADFDGNLYFSSTGGDDSIYKFGFIQATAICEGFVVDSYEKDQMTYEEFSLPTVKYIVNNVEKTDADIAVSATFNDAAIEVLDSYVFNEVGILNVTYTYKDLTETVTININRGKMLAGKSNLIEKIDNISWTMGEAQVGNISGGQYPAESYYGIKLPEDSSGAYGGASVTIEIATGDLSKFSKIEMTFWALGLQGDTWTVSVGGVVVHTQDGWRGWENPVIVQFPVSLVSDGKLCITFNQTWATGDELYIQSIEALNIADFETNLPTYFSVNKEIKAGDYTATCTYGGSVLAEGLSITSAKFNGVEVALPYTPTEEGLMTLVYKHENFNESFDVPVYASNATIVTKDSLISKTTLVEGFAAIGNVSAPQISGHGSYCIKLAEDYTHYSATIEIDVGDVSGFSKLEMVFWGLGLQGDTWAVSTGDTVLHTHAGWRSWDNPVTVEIPISAVVNGKLRLTFTETWATGDEFYIQSIKAIA